MSVELVQIHTIPVYEGLTPEQSWALIVLADGGPVDDEYASGKLEGWANMGIWTNSLGESFAAPLGLTDEAIGILEGYELETEEEAKAHMAEAVL